MTRPVASRVVLSYPEGASEWARDQIETDRYRGYFARVLGAVAVGDRREEFVDVGDDSVSEAAVTADTEIAYRRHPGDVDGGWRVQSSDGPRA